LTEVPDNEPGQRGHEHNGARHITRDGLALLTACCYGSLSAVPVRVTPDDARIVRIGQ
jgi:hypothetical protein